MICVKNYEDVLREMNAELYDNTINGKCCECGSCCSNLLPMSRIEIDRIKRYIRKNNIKEQKHIIPTVAAVVDLTCPFLNIGKKKHKCTIYEVRPTICKCFVCNDPKGAVRHKELFVDMIPVNVRACFFGRK